VPHWDSTAAGPREGDPAPSYEIRQQINKRLTLNTLIQGAAAHSCLTAHHLVKEELEETRPGLTRYYDSLAVGLMLNYFIGDIPLLYGLPSRFWNDIGRPAHPFHRHRLLAAHGRELWQESKRYLLARGRKKSIICFPVIHHVQLNLLFARVAKAERGSKLRLARIAEYANSLIWGIDQDRLEARLTADVAFGHLREPKTAVGRFTREVAVGYGGVERRDGQFKVVARARSWPLVSHELAKGIVELLCLHGLNTLDEETYRIVTDEADQLEYETWTLQAGSELWRRLLAALPDGHVLSEALMHIARLDPEPLERLMLAVVTDPAQARALLQRLG
jgi:hypothetical protein